MKRLPSYIEHTGWYNIIIDEHDFAGYTPAFCTTDKLPELTWDEFFAVRQVTNQCLFRHSRQPGFADAEVEAYFRYSVRDELMDRTIRLDLPEIGLLTTNLVRHLQQDVLATYPLWRILISGSSPETMVIIYPSIVRTGQGWSADKRSWTCALEVTVAKERNLQEQFYGAKRRQLDYVREKVKEYVATVRDTEPGFAVVAVFDNWRGDKESLCIWLLSRGKRRSDYVLVKPTAGRTDFFAVRNDGDFGLHYQPSQAELWLTEWPIPSDTKEITLQKINSRLNPVGRQWQIPVNAFRRPGSASL